MLTFRRMHPVTLSDSLLNIDRETKPYLVAYNHGYRLTGITRDGEGCKRDKRNDMNINKMSKREDTILDVVYLR